MKSTHSLALAGASLIAGGVVGAMQSATKGGGDVSVSHTGLTIEQVQALSSLVTTRVDVADVLETHLDGHTGGIKAALLIKGDYLLGVDLAQAKFATIDADAHTAVLTLPQPQITSPRLDQERTRLFALSETGLWSITPGDVNTSAAVVNRAYRDAQRFVGEATSDPRLLARSREQAERVLGAFFEALGWKVQIRWAG